MLFNEEWQAQNRGEFLKGGYELLDETTGTYKLMACGSGMDWNIPYEQLELPVRCITGLQDRVFLDRDDVEELLAQLPDSRHDTMENAGHLIPAERPKEFARMLVDFAKSLEETGRPAHLPPDEDAEVPSL